MLVAPGGGGSGTVSKGNGQPVPLPGFSGWEVTQTPHGPQLVGAVTSTGQLIRPGGNIPGMPGYHLIVPSSLLGGGGGGGGGISGGVSGGGGGGGVPGGTGGGGGTSATTNPLTQSVGSCPSILSNPLGWIACTAETSLGSSQVGQFLTDPVDALERIGLVLFGIILVILGIAILGFGPLAKSLGIVAGTATKARVISDVAGIGGSRGGPTPEQKEERSKRVELAERNLALGERKQDFRESRERRLTATSRHRSGREPNPTPQHS